MKSKIASILAIFIAALQQKTMYFLFIVNIKCQLESGPK